MILAYAPKKSKAGQFSKKPDFENEIKGHKNVNLLLNKKIQKNEKVNYGDIKYRNLYSSL